MPRTRLRLMGLCGWLAAASVTFAQTWTPTSAPTNYWQSVASSADGKVLAAAAGHQLSIGNYAGGVFISTNSGADWFQANLPSANFYSGIVSSADGSRLAATFNNGGIYYSTDFGATWSLNSTFFPPKFGGLTHVIASSADGTKLAVSCSMIYMSINGGAAWFSNNIAGPRYASIACSTDGNKLAVASLSASAIYLSTNAGITWTTSNVPNGAFQDMASSADGSRLIAAGSLQIASPIYTSSDSGMTWVSNNTPRTTWQAVAASADGSFMAAAGWPASFSLSTNGVWATNATPVAGQGIVALASSADGGRLVAASGADTPQGNIYILQTIRPPRLNFAVPGGGLVLSWLVPSTNYVLQQSSDLVAWADLTNPPSLNLTNLQYQVSLSPSNSSGFYRLAIP
jgi:hypothetical protein